MAKKNPELPEFVKSIAGVVLIIVGSLLGALIAAALYASLPTVGLTAFVRPLREH